MRRMQAVEGGEAGQDQPDESMNSEVDSDLYRRRTCIYRIEERSENGKSAGREAFFMAAELARHRQVQLEYKRLYRMLLTKLDDFDKRREGMIRGRIR